jgi:uncharacterized protein YcbK (DUF882 family)
MGDLSKHFNRSEFSCRCNCGQDTVDAVLLEQLEEVREHFGVPVTITSANRCVRDNERVGGMPNSQHLYGRAADIIVRDVEPDDVADFLEDKASGLGRYSTFTHLDSRSGFNARWSGA